VGVVTGIVLASSVIFERDKRVELITPDIGRITLIGKGAAASVRRFGGRVEPTTVIEATVRKSGALWPMSDSVVVEAFPRIRENFNRISVAMYFINLVRKMTVDYQPHPELYALLLLGLRQLGAQLPNLAQIRQEFEAQLMMLEGLADDQYHSLQFTQRFAEYTGSLVVPPALI